MSTQTPNTAAAHRLQIRQDDLDQMIAHVREWYPNEGCGLLATQGDEVVHVYKGDNIKQSKVLYEMDPRQVLDAMREIDDNGWRLGAIFHSHPSSQSWPSETDLNLIFDPAVYMVIISLVDEEPDVRAFRYDGEIYEVPIEILTPKGSS
jgi:[CysO sulfur-carrier protein]-S-L-cysteine hydrolase